MRRTIIGLIALLSLVATMPVAAQTPAQPAREKIIIDADIGDDIDDAFAVALALQSPEFEILGINAAFGDTATRARLLDRFLGEVGRSDIPVTLGVASNANGPGFNQKPYALASTKFARPGHPQAVDFMIEQIRKYPGQITLVVLGPAPTIGALIDRDPATFRKLKRIVTMGGSIGPMRDMFGFAPSNGPMPEWNIKNDIPAQQKMYASGVPIFMMPLDSTANLKLDDVKRNLLFAQGTPVTDALTLLYHQWVYGTRNTIPTLFDPMTIAFMADPSLCPVTPLRIKVDDAGYTRVEQGAPNAQVCLKSDPEAFLRFVMGRLAPRR